MKHKKGALYTGLCSQIEPLIIDAIEKRLFPGCAIGVWDKEAGDALLCWGRETYAPDHLPITPYTIFDLASLTKPLSTTLLTAYLISHKEIGREEIGLETSLGDIAQYLPCCPEDKQGLTIADLLCHTAGFPPYLPLYKMAGSKDEYLKIILNADISASWADFGYKTGRYRRNWEKAHKKRVYSDLGFILLGIILERIFDMPLNEAFNAYILPFWEIKSDLIGYSEICAHKNSIAPTLKCTERLRFIRGEVNDLNAWKAGGICGHAGLFASLSSILAMLKHLYNDLSDNFNSPSNTFMPTSVKQAILSCPSLGFDTPSLRNSQAGKRFSSASIGHLGYTGTSFWIDMEQGIIITVLTNRTYPYDSSDSRELIKIFRRNIHDAIIEALRG